VLTEIINFKIIVQIITEPTLPFCTS